MASSYEIICELARMAPYREYLLLEAQPPSMMPYTPSETKPIMYKMPMLMLVTCKSILRPPSVRVVPQGITAEVISATKMKAPGARIYSQRSD